MWISKTSQRKVTGAPKLDYIPPTSKAFEQNVRLAHFQVSVWKAVLEKDYPDLVPIGYGWETDEASKAMLPITSEGAALAPLGVIKVIMCISSEFCLVYKVQIESVTGVSHYMPSIDYDYCNVACFRSHFGSHI